MALEIVTAVFLNMVFRDEDKILINNLHHLKGYKAMEQTIKFPNKMDIKSINRLLI